MTVKIKDKKLFDKYLKAKQVTANVNKGDDIVFVAYCFLSRVSDDNPIKEVQSIVNAIFRGEEVELDEQKYVVKIASEIPSAENILDHRYLVKNDTGVIFQDEEPFESGYDGQLTWSEIPEEYRKWAKKVEG